ncbi:YjcZ family sporulation protein [Metabacillus arenae]|uniref:YjcZ family sporulation protein n=1 Tax=Metabacillus arenae TaxID=2771434 RepID=A0A926NDP8_9BACI|nr:YjcZ family sporulation protein [Metabacillus arenae]MBD1379255.1 YjcZ family sporulation protein [Metabacillus arenae]
MHCYYDCGYPYTAPAACNNGGSFVLIVVLFILLIIVGASFIKY